MRIKLPNGQEESKDDEVFRRRFLVSIGPLDVVWAFLGAHWQWIVTTLVGAGCLSALGTALRKWAGRRAGPRQP